MAVFASSEMHVLGEFGVCGGWDKVLRYERTVFKGDQHCLGFQLARGFEIRLSLKS